MFIELFTKVLHLKFHIGIVIVIIIIYKLQIFYQTLGYNKTRKMRFSNLTYIILFSLVTLTSQAQNKHFDWGFGAYGSLYSYAAILENKVTSPYQYNRGTQITVSKYLNNNFDIDFNAGITTTRYFDENQYNKTRLYDGAFSLKYKLDNGYIIKKENFVVSPFLKAGVGANWVDYRQAVDISVPAGFGLQVSMGKYVSFVYETSYRYNILASNAYMAHGMGLKFNFGGASKDRLAAQRKREQVRRLARIEKYRNKKERNKKETIAAIFDDGKDDDISNSFKEEPAAPRFEDPVEEEPVVEVEAEKFKAPREEPTEVPVEYNEPEKPTFEPTFEKEEAPAKPEDGVKPVKVADEFCVKSDKVLTEFGKEVTFDVNEHKISSKMFSALNSIFETMNKCEETRFVVIAHTDSDGDAEYNSRLAKKRAEAVKAFLVRKGIDASRLTTLAYGEYSLITDEASDDDKSANRRISFKINKSSK